MRTSDVRKKYPEFFATIEAAVWDDSVGSVDNQPFHICDKVRKRLAYNAAAVATFELHKIVSGIKKQFGIITNSPKPKYTARPARSGCGRTT